MVKEQLLKESNWDAVTELSKNAMEIVNRVRQR